MVLYVNLLTVVIIYIYMVKIYYLGLLNENVTIVKLFWFVEEHYIKNNIIKK